MLSLSLLQFNAQSQQSDIRVEITGQTTMNDLADIKVEMLEAGALFQMADLSFTDEGYVSRISITVNFNDGNQGSATCSDFSNGKKLMIVRNFSKDAPVPFCIGNCD